MKELESYIAECDYKVFVHCNTFNQSAYIKDALNGFVIQQTNFPFVCMVMDDCSTDGEQQILLDWMSKECDMTNTREFDIPDSKVVIAQHKTNNNCTFAFYLLKRNTWKERKVRLAIYNPWRSLCEYEALCEGDDYWTDSLKLQRQYDYMENHKECALCFHQVKVKVLMTGELVEDFITRDVPQKTGIEDLAAGNFIHTPSVLFRINDSVLNKFYGLGFCMPGDYVLWMLTAETGYLYKINEQMAVYRYGTGVWTSGNNLEKYINYSITLGKIYAVIESSSGKKNIEEKVMNELKQTLLCRYKMIEIELENVRNSYSYRIGRLVTSPFRLIRKLLVND